jgi:uncharacterized delta-60 repeat protein
MRSFLLSIVLLTSVFNVTFSQNDGSLDLTFGIQGGCYNPVSSGIASTIVLDNDAIIYAAYTGTGSLDGNGDYTTITGNLTKLDPNGIVDQSFGNQGFTDFNPGFSFGPSDIGVMDDGSIMGVGYNLYNNTGGSIFKVTANGVMDANFGTNGFLTPTFATSDTLLPALVLIEHDNQNRMIIGGFMTYPTSGGLKAFLMRIDSDGNIDHSFGNAGYFLLPFTSSRISEIIALPDGIIVCGSEIIGTGSASIFSTFTLKINTSGVLDASFGDGGIFQLAPGSSNRCTDGALMPDGRIALSYFFPVGSLFNSGISMVNANGTSDQNYGTNASVILPVPSTTATIIDDIVPLPDGSIIGVGYSVNSLNQATGQDLTVFKTNPQGLPDNTFGNQSTIIETFASGNDNYSKVNLQSNNNIIVSGSWAFSFPSSPIGNGWSSTICRRSSGYSDPTSTLNDKYSSITEIYPNPVSAKSGLINLPVSDVPRTISLTDLSGRLIFKQSLIKGSNQVQLPTELPIGIYFIQQESQDQTSTSKLIIK